MHTHFLSLYKNEAKQSGIWALPSTASDVIWSMSLQSSAQEAELTHTHACLPNCRQNTAVNHDIWSGFHSIE